MMEKESLDEQLYSAKVLIAESIPLNDRKYIERVANLLINTRKIQSFGICLKGSLFLFQGTENHLEDYCQSEKTVLLPIIGHDGYSIGYRRVSFLFFNSSFAVSLVSSFVNFGVVFLFMYYFLRHQTVQSNNTQLRNRNQFATQVAHDI
ncbi:MAG: hypothetical protein KAG61_01915, partial [Bacteriovoracaceae bacterium]|nr:hypothetical protein [Bacteriovoracaceae bacterium]